jgi:hemolysin III
MVSQEYETVGDKLPQANENICDSADPAASRRNSSEEELSDDLPADDRIERRVRQGAILPLSMRLVMQISGIGCCQECTGSMALPGSNSTNRNGDDANHEETALLGDYDLRALRRQKSAISPLVVGPMMMPGNIDKENSLLERIISEYIASCRFYGCTDRVNAGVLTTLRFSLPSLRVSGSFHDADMLALAEIMIKYGNGALRYIKRLDFSLSSKEGKLNGKAGFRSHGAFTLAKILQISDYIEEVFVDRNRLGPYGASALFIACSSNSSLKRLLMRRCRVRERGALAFAELISTSSECGLVEVDLSANGIGFKGSVSIERAIVERNQNSDLPALIVNMEGNLVLQEVLNGVTHGLGIILALMGSSLLSSSVRHQPSRHVVSCAVYSTSLIVLYTSSTLYHSFFILQNTKYIFEVMDKCAIYILIAGSYTPFLQIVLQHDPLWANGLLAFIWCCCLLGISVEAFFPTYKHKGLFSLAMYLGMGWCCIVCLPEFSRIVPTRLIHLVILGGAAYTLGVPFFVRNNHLDHCIWHIFVMVGSIFHWCGIYFYVATFDDELALANASSS